MNYNEDSHIESLLRDEARTVVPSPQVMRRIVDGMPRRMPYKKWFFAIPVFAVLFFVLYVHKAPPQSMETIGNYDDAELAQQEIVVYEELSNIDNDLFSEFDDEDSDLLDILREGSIVGAL